MTRDNEPISEDVVAVLTGATLTAAKYQNKFARLRYAGRIPRDVAINYNSGLFNTRVAVKFFIKGHMGLADKYAIKAISYWEALWKPYLRD